MDFFDFAVFKKYKVLTLTYSVTNDNNNLRLWSYNDILFQNLIIFGGFLPFKKIK